MRNCSPPSTGVPEHMNMLPHILNRFNGIEVNTNELPADPAIFAQSLSASLVKWIQDGRLLVWLHLPIERAALIPCATEAGFTFHHSEPQYALLVRRLQEDALVPGYATHYIGAGGVVINERQELLVVSERHRSSARPYYKLPGGALHPGEHLAAGVVREVYEETGVETKFEAVVCWRHWHGYRYGKSDIYFICRLSPLTEAIERDAWEIEECLWMQVEEYLQHELVGTFNREIVQAAIKTAGLKNLWMDGYDDPTMREFFWPV